ncbi:MAG: hypothetical protein ACJ8IR_02685 [Alphaproteobacteria bacterium]
MWFAVLAAQAAHADISISNKPTQNMSCNAGVCTATANKAVLNVGDLQTMLASGDVAVRTGTLAKDIDLDQPLTWANISRLTLDAQQSVVVKKKVTIPGAGALTIITNDGGKHGEFIIVPEHGSVQFWDLASSLVIDGNSYTLLKTVRQLAKAVKANSAGLYAFARNYDAAHDGSYSRSPVSQGFNGIFEGLGNVVSNLSIVDDHQSAITGLFYGSIGTIRDIGLSHVAVTASGGRFSEVGGLVGRNFGYVIRCFATGTVGVKKKGVVGGLVGHNISALISNSSAAVAVSGGKYSNSGGLVGRNEGSIDRSHASGPVTGGAFVGGLVGSMLQSGGVITLSYATGDVSGWAAAGGLVGVTGLPGGSFFVDQSFATGNISGSGSVGGLMGWTDASVTNSYATGAVGGADSSTAGGLIGKATGYFSQTYSTGTVTGRHDGEIGGFIGEDGRSSFQLDYWNLDASGINDPHKGAGNILDDPGITGLTDVQLKSGLPDGFDPKVWAQSPNTNNGYPYLLANPPR